MTQRGQYRPNVIYHSGIKKNKRNDLVTQERKSHLPLRKHWKFKTKRNTFSLKQPLKEEVFEWTQTKMETALTSTVGCWLKWSTSKTLQRTNVESHDDSTSKSDLTVLAQEQFLHESETAFLGGFLFILSLNVAQFEVDDNLFHILTTTKTTLYNTEKGVNTMFALPF